MKKILTYLSLLVLSTSLTFGLQVVTWNTENNPDNAEEDVNFNVVIELLGEFAILGLNETDLGSSVRLQGLVNTYHNTTAYQILTSERATYYDRVGILYDSRQVTLIDLVEVDSYSLTRSVLRALFRPYGTDGSMDFYFYTLHLKSGSTLEVQNQRTIEATIIQIDIASLPASSYVIVAGDFNMQSSNQTAWSVFTALGQNHLQDIAQAEGNWKDNWFFKHLHSQDPGLYLDDRFDIIMGTSNFQNDFQLEIPKSSYRVIGNDGSHFLNYPLTTGTSLSQAQLTALGAASDHLPVVVEMQYIPQVEFTEITESSVTLQWKGLPNTSYDIYASEYLNNTGLNPNYPEPLNSPLHDSTYPESWGRIDTHTQNTMITTKTITWDIETYNPPHFWSLSF
jgi:endonuclease/exonuclease/phosphatase family metal-dependent hydrolase